MNSPLPVEISKEMLYNDQIVSYTVHSLNIAVLSSWNESIVETLQDWKDDKYYLTLYDLSSGGVSMPFLVLNSHKIYNLSVTPMGRVHVDKILAQKPNLKVRLAFVFGNTLTGNISLKRGLSSEFEPDDTAFEYRAFYERELAIEWLKSFIQAPS